MITIKELDKLIFLSTKEIKLENKIPRPFGIRLLGSFLISEGIFMVIFGIIYQNQVI
ncbi:hypothetical protein LCGC14_2776180 [marine sediment metagenome]|uniref:Uncharacterized protein n=1 Tax=marine sediment metagenome TaxID=412755 RepID=A0A0F8ZGL3_9ZZZZ